MGSKLIICLFLAENASIFFAFDDLITNEAIINKISHDPIFPSQENSKNKPQQVTTVLLIIFIIKTRSIQQSKNTMATNFIRRMLYNYSHGNETT